LGYARDPRLLRIQTLTLDGNQKELPIKGCSYITLFITIEPQLLVPEVFNESYDTNEEISLLDRAVKWTQDFKKKFPKRDFKPTAMDTKGRTVFLTRYIKPIDPPVELIMNDSKTSFETIVNPFFSFSFLLFH
jgi:hypothetical protein